MYTQPLRSSQSNVLSSSNNQHTPFISSYFSKYTISDIPKSPSWDTGLSYFYKANDQNNVPFSYEAERSSPEESLAHYDSFPEQIQIKENPEYTPTSIYNIALNNEQLFVNLIEINQIDINQPHFEGGNTFLHKALSEGNNTLALLLLQTEGINKTILNNEEKTAFDIFRENIDHNPIHQKTPKSQAIKEIRKQIIQAFFNKN